MSVTTLVGLVTWLYAQRYRFYISLRIELVGALMLICVVKGVIKPEFFVDLAPSMENPKNRF
jgi:hypothetical protein